MAKSFYIPVKSAEKNSTKIIGNQQITFDEKRKNNIFISSNNKNEPTINADLNKNILTIKFEPGSPALERMLKVEGALKFLKADGTFEFPIKSVTVDGKENFSFEIESIKYTFNVTADNFVVQDENKVKTQISATPDNVFNASLSEDFFANLNLGAKAPAPKINVTSLPIQTFDYLNTNPEVAKKYGLESFHLRNLHLLKVDGQILIARGNTITPIADKDVDRAIFFAENGSSFRVAFGMQMNRNGQITEAVGMASLSRKELEALQTFLGHSDKVLTQAEYDALKIYPKNLVSYKETTKRADNASPLPPRPPRDRTGVIPEDIIVDPPPPDDTVEPPPEDGGSPDDTVEPPPEDKDKKKKSPEQEDDGGTVEPPPEDKTDGQDKGDDKVEPEPPKDGGKTGDTIEPEPPKDGDKKGDTIEPEPPKDNQHDDTVDPPPTEKEDEGEGRNKGDGGTGGGNGGDGSDGENGGNGGGNGGDGGDGGEHGIVPFTPNLPQQSPEQEPEESGDPTPLNPGGDGGNGGNGGGNGGDSGDNGGSTNPEGEPEQEGGNGQQPAAPAQPAPAPAKSKKPDFKKDALKITGALTKLLGFGLIMASIAVPGLVFLGALLFLGGYISDDVVDLVETILKYRYDKKERRRNQNARQAERTQDRQQEQAPELSQAQEQTQDEQLALTGEDKLLLTDGKEKSQDSNPELPGGTPPLLGGEANELGLDEEGLRVQDEYEAGWDIVHQTHDKYVQEKNELFAAAEQAISEERAEVQRLQSRAEALRVAATTPEQKAKAEKLAMEASSRQAALTIKEAEFNKYKEEIATIVETDMAPTVKGIAADRKEVETLREEILAQENEGAVRLDDGTFYYEAASDRKKKRAAEQAATASQDILRTELSEEERKAQVAQEEVVREDQMAQARHIEEEKKTLVEKMKKVNESQEQAVQQDSGPYAKVKSVLNKISQLFGKNKTQTAVQNVDMQQN